MRTTNKTCQICGGVFYARASQIKRGGGKFCSQKCGGVWRSKEFVGENSPTWKGGSITRKCETCGMAFKVKACRIKNNNSRFCSQRCFGVWRSKYQIKENNPCWRGGVTPIAQKIKTSDAYNHWRKQIFKRDNYTCQKCGDRAGGNINAHHIKRFSVILNDIKQKFPLLSLSDVAVNYPDLWDIKNGVTLCKKCHIEAHCKQTP